MVRNENNQPRLERKSRSSSN